MSISVKGSRRIACHRCLPAQTARHLHLFRPPLPPRQLLRPQALGPRFIGLPGVRCRCHGPSPSTSQLPARAIRVLPRQESFRTFLVRVRARPCAWMPLGARSCRCCSDWLGLCGKPRAIFSRVHDLEVQNRFVQLRSPGRSFARIAQELHVRENMAREDPEHFGPHAWERALRQIEDERRHQEMDEALRRVYGSEAAPPARRVAPVNCIPVKKRSSFGREPQVRFNSPAPCSLHLRGRSREDARERRQFGAARQRLRMASGSARMVRGCGTSPLGVPFCPVAPDRSWLRCSAVWK